MEKGKYYITTPIYYPSGNWHIGHCYTTVCCDSIARFKRMQGYDVFYLTGTDEHGLKIEKRAAESKLSPKAFVDKLVFDLNKLWELLDITNDKFIRTTDDYHKKAVQKIFEKLYEKGEIYKGTYEGKYCAPCESFWTSTQLVNGKCPDCGRDVSDAQEECYFFKLSKYEKQLKQLLTQTDFLQPQSRVNEMVNNFLDKGLTDLAVSRTSFKWGIPVSFDGKHIIYVWIDALSNYITALGYGGDDTSLFDKFWPADIHVMAKEIVRFHSIIWPAILMALDLPLPKKIYGHGWILFGGDKMSKSKGNVVDPFILCDRYSTDSLRYFLLREIPFGSDYDYSNESLLNCINKDLVNDLGNLVRRTLAMANQYFKGDVTFKGTADKTVDDDFISTVNGLYSKLEAEMEKPMVNKALEQIMNTVRACNKYIDSTEPWVLFKNNNLARLECVIYNLLEAIRIIAVCLKPFLTKYPDIILSQGLDVKIPQTFDNLQCGGVKTYKTKEIPPILNRLDIQKELKELAMIADNNENKNQAVKAETEKSAIGEVEKTETAQISIEDFFKTELRVVKVVECQRIEKADKLLKLTVDDGEGLRTVVSGIAQSYAPEQLIGREVVLVANLKPAVIRSITSHGMILCAIKDGKPVLVSPQMLCGAGSKVC